MKKKIEQEMRKIEKEMKRWESCLLSY